MTEGTTFCVTPCSFVESPWVRRKSTAVLLPSAWEYRPNNLLGGEESHFCSQAIPQRENFKSTTCQRLPLRENNCHSCSRTSPSEWDFSPLLYTGSFLKFLHIYLLLLVRYNPRHEATSAVKTLPAITRRAPPPHEMLHLNHRTYLLHAQLLLKTIQLLPEVHHYSPTAIFTNEYIRQCRIIKISLLDTFSKGLLFLQDLVLGWYVPLYDDKWNKIVVYVIIICNITILNIILIRRNIHCLPHNFCITNCNI